MQTIKNTLRKAKSSNLDPEIALLCLRATPIDHALPSPSELSYNRKVTANLPTKCPNNERNKEAVRERLEARQDSQKSYFDQRAKDLPPLIVGQKVSVEDPTTGRWKAAKVISKTDQPRSYVVVTQDQRQYRRNRRHLRHTPQDMAAETGNRQETAPTPPPPEGDKTLPDSVAGPDRPPVRDLPTSDATPKAIPTEEKHPSPKQETCTRSGRAVRKPPRYQWLETNQ